MLAHINIAFGYTIYIIYYTLYTVGIQCSVNFGQVCLTDGKNSYFNIIIITHVNRQNILFHIVSGVLTWAFLEDEGQI